MRWLTLATLATIVFFLLFPRIDLAVSQLFYAPEGGFIYEWHPVLRNTYLSVRFIADMYLITLLGMGLSLILGNRRLRWKSWCFLVLVVLVGPLILIEHTSKDIIERPRPREILEFGGTLKYVAPLTIGSEGGRSSASNHAAVGFYVAAFAFLLKGRHRRKIYISGLLLGTLIGFVRIMQGGHFLSDVVFSGVIMLWTIHLLAWIMRLETPQAKESHA